MQGTSNQKQSIAIKSYQIQPEQSQSNTHQSKGNRQATKGNTRAIKKQSEAMAQAFKNKQKTIICN